MADLEPIEGDEDALDHEDESETSSDVPAANPEPTAQATDPFNPDAPPPKRGRGRPKGYAKTGGRVKGSPKSWSAPEIRDMIINGGTIELMLDIVAGKKIYCADGPSRKPGWYYPTLRERRETAGDLLQDRKS